MKEPNQCKRDTVEVSINFISWTMTLIVCCIVCATVWSVSEWEERKSRKVNDQRNERLADSLSMKLHQANDTIALYKANAAYYQESDLESRMLVRKYIMTLDTLYTYLIKQEQWKNHTKKKY